MLVVCRERTSLLPSMILNCSEMFGVIVAPFESPIYVPCSQTGITNIGYIPPLRLILGYVHAALLKS